jgi:hypothetical protein
MDITVTYCGTIAMIRPHTPAATAWIDANIALESEQWFGGTFSCEHRYLHDLVEGMALDGLEVNVEKRT